MDIYSIQVLASEPTCKVLFTKQSLLYMLYLNSMIFFLNSIDASSEPSTFLKLILIQEANFIVLLGMLGESLLIS